MQTIMRTNKEDLKKTAEKKDKMEDVARSQPIPWAWRLKLSTT